MGPQNENSPSRLIIVDRIPGFAIIQPATRAGKLLAGELASKETYEVVETDLRIDEIVTSNRTYVYSRDGRIHDNIVAQAPPTTTGRIVANQSYSLWFRAKGDTKGYRYPISTKFQQIHEIKNGVDSPRIITVDP